MQVELTPALVRSLRKKLVANYTKYWEDAELTNALDLAIRRGGESKCQVLKDAINFLYA